MVIKTIRVGKVLCTFEWHPDPTGEGGIASMVPGITDFHADNFEDAAQKIREAYHDYEKRYSDG